MAQVQLIAAMCMGRSLNCMLAMRNEYPFLLVATAMSDHRLPPQVRMAFAELMNALYVDDVAHTKMEPPIEVLAPVRVAPGAARGAGALGEKIRCRILLPDLSAK